MQIKSTFSLLALLLLLMTGANAQDITFRDLVGVSVKGSGYAEIKGSPYFSDEWLPGAIKANDGKVYNNVFIKLDEVKNQLLLKLKLNDEASESTVPIVEFRVMHFGASKVFKAQKVGAKTKFMEVIYDGKVSLLKLHQKDIMEDRAFNSATADKKIVESIVYYLSYNGEIQKVKLNSKNILTAFGDQRKNVEKHINENGLNLELEEDVVKTLKFYSSLE